MFVKKTALDDAGEAEAEAEAEDSDNKMREPHITEELYVNGNSVGDEGVRALVSGLVLHKGKLTALDIGNNAISSKGAHHVAEFIKGSKTLTWISIYMNDIGDELRWTGDAFPSNMASPPVLMPVPGAGKFEKNKETAK